MTQSHERSIKPFTAA